MDRQKLAESRNLEHRAALFRQSGQREGLPLVSPVNEQLRQRAHTRGIEKRNASQIENEMSRRFRPQGLNEIVDRLEAKFAIEPHHDRTAVGSCLFFQIQVSWLHKARRVVQN